MGHFGVGADIRTTSTSNRQAVELPDGSSKPSNSRGSSKAHQPFSSTLHASQAGGPGFKESLADHLGALGQCSTASASAETKSFDSSAFAELDANQDPIQRARFAPAGKDSASMGDQGKQQAPMFSTGVAGPAANGAAPGASWATFLSGVQHQAYVSPGARAASRRAAQRRGHTPAGASRMQHRSSAAGNAAPVAPGQGPAAAGASGQAPPTFAFGSPMQQASSSGAPSAAPAAGSTPMIPGTAMSTDSALPDFTAAFSAMSVDAATPAVGSDSTGQPWAFRGGRAAPDMTGKRLFDTPSSAADASTPSPFSAWGRHGGEGSNAGQGQAGAAGSRAGPEPVPFPGFGGSGTAGSGSSSSPAGGFNLGKATPGYGRPKQRSSPARKLPPEAPSFAGFGSPGFGPTATSSSSSQAAAGSTSGGGAAPFASFSSTSFQAGGSSTTATPGVASGGSFQGFFAGKAPGSGASTPGYSPMMWSPVDHQAARTTSSPVATAAAASVSFDAVQDRQQSAAASEQVAEARIQQVQRHLAQQQGAAAGAGADDTAAAAAVDLPSDDSVEYVAEVLADLSTSGRHGPAPAPPETEAVAGLRAAVEQLSTAESRVQQQAQQQQQGRQPQQQQAPSQQPQQPPAEQKPAAVSSFVFGSPDAASATAGTSTAGLFSPGASGVTPTTLFEMSPLRSSSAAGAAQGAKPPASMPFTSFGAAPAAAAASNAAASNAADSAAASAAAPAAHVNGNAGADTSGGGAAPATAGFTFTPGKGSKSTVGPGATSRSAVRAKRHTPAKPQMAQQTAAERHASQAPVANGFAAGEAATGATAAPTAQQPGNVFVQAQQHQQQAQQQGQQQQASQGEQQPAAASFGAGFAAFGAQQQQAAAGPVTFTPRRKLHAAQRRSKLASPQQQQEQQQQQPASSGAQWQWPPSAAQQPWPPASAAPAAPNIQFTLGSSKGSAAGAHGRSPRKSRPGQQQGQQQQQQAGAAEAQAGVTVQQALASARASMTEAEGHWRHRSWDAAEKALTRGIYAVSGHAQTSDDAAAMLCDLFNHRASARIGHNKPLDALEDALSSIKCRRKYIKGYLRVSTCLVKLGCPTAADRVLDKVLDMISASSPHWHDLNSKRRQVQQLLHKQQRVVAAALGCDTAGAAAALAAATAGQAVKARLEGFVSVAHAVDAGQPVLADAGTSALEDAQVAKDLLSDAEAVATEMEFWQDSMPLQAWLQLRCGQLDAAAKAAQAKPCPFFTQACKQQRAGDHPEWRWWLLAQVKWHQGDLTAVRQLLQQGQEQLQKLSSSSSSASSGSSTALWQVLLPTLEELPELLEQTQQLLALKEAGNAAITAKQFDKAAEAYNKALALQPSCSFAAVIHSNRAATHQLQERLVEALADCSRAVALDPKYARAYLRMAQILQSLNRADRAVVVLQDALKGSANAVDPATTRGHELTHGTTFLTLSSADRRKFEDMLATAQSAARKFKTPQHYKALGLALTATEADVRKAYRALALKHHPDKALQQCRWAAKFGRAGAAAAHVTAASGGVEASLKAAANEVFGYLSAAHEELTNSTSRSKLDRDLRTEEQLYGNGNSSYGSMFGGSSFSGRPASYNSSHGGRRAYGGDWDFDGQQEGPSREGSSSHYSSRPWWQQSSRAQPTTNTRAGGAAGSRPSGGGGPNKWYEDGYWASTGDDEASDEDDHDDYSYGKGYHYRSRY